MNKKAISMAIAASLLVASPIAVQKKVNANMEDKQAVKKETIANNDIKVYENILNKAVETKATDNASLKLKQDLKNLDSLLAKVNNIATSDVDKNIYALVQDVNVESKTVDSKNNANTSNSENTNVDINKKDNEPLSLTLDKSIEIAMKNNTILKSLEVDVESAGLTLDRAEYNQRKINKGNKNLDKARDQYAPILSQLEKTASTLPEGSEQRKQIERQIKQIQDGLSNGEARLDGGVEEANSVIAEKLKLDVDRVLEVNSTTELMTTMADLQNEVTKDGYLIAQKQVALLTRQKYYEVIKNKKIEELKKVALDRASKQYQMSKDAFEQGMKAKDDVLLAQAQVKLMNADYRKAIMNTKNAEIELKKVINIDMKTQIKLVEDFTTKKTDVNLEDGIKQGLEKRIEIRKAMAQYLVDKLNFELTSKQYPENTYQYKETKIKMNKSKVELDSKYSEVEASIRQSYEAVIATEDMISYIDNVVANAKESLEIAEYRYKEGYGFETSVLKSANLEDVSGTIVEVIAAQERLSDIEEKVVEIIFNYNLANDKYLNDIGTY